MSIRAISSALLALIIPLLSSCVISSTRRGDFRENHYAQSLPGAALFFSPEFTPASAPRGKFRMTGLSRPLNPLAFSVSDQWLDEYAPGEKRRLVIDVDVYELPSMKFLGHARDEGHRSHRVVKHAKLCTDFLLFYQVAQPCPARVKATFVYHQAPPSP